MAARKKVAPAATEPPAEDFSFLRNLGNQEIYWKFTMISGETYYGSVVDFIHTAVNQVPLSLKIRNSAMTEEFELLWHAIESITRSRNKNG